MYIVELKYCSVLLHVVLIVSIVLNQWLKPVKCAHEAGGQHRSLSFKFSSFLKPPGGSLNAAGGANRMFPQFSFLNPAGLGWPPTSSNLSPSNQLHPGTEKEEPTAQPPVSTTSLGSLPFNPHFLQPHGNQNSTGNGKSFVSFLTHSNQSSIAKSSEMFPFLNNNTTNTSGSVFNFFPNDQLDFGMSNKNLTTPTFGQGIFKTWTFGESPTGNRTAGKFFEHVYTDLQNKSDSLNTNITVFGLRPSEIKDNPNKIMSSTRLSHHGNLGRGFLTNKTHGSPFQTMFQELMLPSSLPNSSKHFINLPDSIRNRIESMNSEMLTDKSTQSHSPSSEFISHLGVNTNKGNNPDNKVENIFKRLDLPMFKRKHLKLPSLEIQDRLRQLVDRWIRNREDETNYNTNAINKPKETNIPPEINISKETNVPPELKAPKERKVQPQINIPKEIKVPPEVKTPTETKTQPAVIISKLTKVPPELKAANETKVQPEVNIPKERKVPPEVKILKETKTPSELNKPRETILLTESISTSKVTTLPSKVINIHKKANIPQEFIDNSTDNMPPIGGEISNGGIDRIIPLSKERTRTSVKISKKPGIVPGSKADRSNETKFNKLIMGINESTPPHFNFDPAKAYRYPDTTRKKEMKENSVLPDLKVISNRTDFSDTEMVVKFENILNQQDKTQKSYSTSLPEIEANNLKEQTPLNIYPVIRKFKTPRNTFHTIKNDTTVTDVGSISAATEMNSDGSVSSLTNNEKKHPDQVINPQTNTIVESYNITTFGQTTVSTHITRKHNIGNAARAVKDIEQNKSAEHVGPVGIDVNMIEDQGKLRVTSGKIITDTPFYSITDTKLSKKNKVVRPITTPVMRSDYTHTMDLQRDDKKLNRNTYVMPMFTTNYRKVLEKMQTQIVTQPPIATPPPIVMPPPVATPPPIIMSPPVATPPPIVMPPSVATPPPIFIPPQIYNIKHGEFKFETALSDMNDLGNRKQFIGNAGRNINISSKESIFNNNGERKSKLKTTNNNIESKQGTDTYFPNNPKSVDRNKPVQPSKSKLMDRDRKTSFENTRQKSPPKVTGLLEQMLAGSSRNTMDLFKLPSIPKFKEQSKAKNVPTVKKEIFPEVIRNDNIRADPKVVGQKSRSLPISILEMFYNGFSKKKTKDTLTPHIPEISYKNHKENAAFSNLPQTDNSNTFLQKMVQDPYKSGGKTLIKSHNFQNNRHSTVKYDDYVSQQTTDAGVNVGSVQRRTEPVMNEKKLFLSQPNTKVNDRTRLGINILNYLLSF